ncbi:MAG: paraquat-inducible protein A [Rhodobacteraceae bacterium]|jgi:paraquat-inducible protein A|nr:paraquat-inducible protein A [Paracoccaceae bacterium]
MSDAIPEPEPLILDRLIACPQCDGLHRDADLSNGLRARCHRCGTLLIAPRAEAFLQVMMLSVTVAILMVGAVFFPFLSVQAAGLSHDGSVFDAVRAFSGPILAPLSVMVLFLIVLIPILRVIAIVYTLWPLTRGQPPYRHAAVAFRAAERLRPWSMTEIFMIGTAVALVKIGGMATVSFGPAFWAFGALVIVLVLEDTFMCKWTIWKAIDTSTPRS